MSLSRSLLALLGLALLSGCAEMNRPIGPNDEWRERATRADNGLPR